MADEEVEEKKETEEEGEEKTKKKGKIPVKLIAIVLIALICIGGGVFGWIMLTKGSDSDSPKGKTSSEENKKAEKEEAFGKIFSFETFIVNLNDPGGNRYLKTKIELELAPTNVETELTARLPQLRDLVLLHLSSKSLEEIQGTTGKIALRNELIMRINQALKTTKVRNLYFTEFVVQ